MTKKKKQAFRTISETADVLGLQTHVLRFWETKFPQITPLKRAGGRRFYRPEDIELLCGIKVLLYTQEHTIKAAQKLIHLKGSRHVRQLGQEKLARVEQPVLQSASSDVPGTLSVQERSNLQVSLQKLQTLKTRWQNLKLG